MAGGRPSKYKPELVNKICELIREGNSLKAVAAMSGMPSEQTLYNWQYTRPEFLEQYERAREERADRMAAEILEIADQTENDTIFVEDSDKDGAGAREVQNHEWINRSRLRVDTRKWLMARMAPKKYGDKVTQEVTGKDGGPLEVAISWVKPNAKD